MNLADLQLTQQGDAIVARVSGEIDLSNAAGIRAAIAEATPNQSLSLVLDLSAVDYLDSAGIQLIYEVRERLRARGQSLRLVIPATSPANDALRLAGVSLHIQTLGTVDEALRDPSD